MNIATFQLDHEAVGLNQAFGQVPKMRVEAERVAAHSTEWTMPCLWISGTDFTAIDEALSSDPSIETIVEAAEFADEKYYMVKWADAVMEQIARYTNQGGSILSATGTPEGWRLRFRFADRDHFDSFRKALNDQNYSYSLLELTEPDKPRLSVGNLTPRQREALVTAWEHGYYKIPREVSGEEIAAVLGISHQTLSELLRRGTEKLIKSQLVTTE
ncbi:hypothetical protein halTADL_1364 [Halohasta litchfieldiae]|jgi:Predicted DNA binding protein|uniref:GAF and HTH_10 associated domain-containing protein n=1 Tax=Halohasta litchfieldiae TaxID=1073996 RepID=A0A1H6W142_9EURY|nr:helix-turn-helix domain-containing protein [Halohasta litchfieldiae]ATW88141.1 hypothetical protein halTADL_1364 [Halohasta litchfieldiae]SEJ10681.1 hypothetical protein SAMN05444271_12149 [Halohasta litchfieldiae]